jgi:hypothetical protein
VLIGCETQTLASNEQIGFDAGNFGHGRIASLFGHANIGCECLNHSGPIMCRVFTFSTNEGTSNFIVAV